MVRYFFIVFFCLIGLVSSQTLTIVDGGGEGSWLIVARNPFYPGVLCQVSMTDVEIVSPVNGSTFIFPNITPNVTLNIQDAASPTCFYRTTGDWNAWEGCSNGLNYKSITLPEGYPTPLTVRVEDVCGSLSDTNYYTVIYRGGLPAIDQKNFWLIIALMSALMLFLLWRERCEEEENSEWCET